MIAIPIFVILSSGGYIAHSVRNRRTLEAAGINVDANIKSALVSVAVGAWLLWAIAGGD